MSILLAGKRPPDELSEVADEGFEAAELYLERSHLDNFEETLTACQQAPIDVVSVHTPHVPLAESEYIRRTNLLADELNALTIVHSTKSNLMEIPDVLDAIRFADDVGFENSIGHSEFHVVNAVLDAGRDLILDTSHLYTAEEEYLDSLERLLTTYEDQIPVVHCCDGQRMRDGLSFGEGEMDMEAVVSLVEEHLREGVVVLEVPPERQADALDAYESYA
jgi:sugar phosphate isomerase/epimerase